MLSSFGKDPTGTRMEKIIASPNYKNGAFQNLSETPMKLEDVSYFSMMRKFFFGKPKLSRPPHVLPYIKTNLNQLPDNSIVWFGHSSYLLRLHGKNILVDPVLSGNASPFSFMVNAFKGANEYGVNNMPAIDILLLTHDHYDHLDHRAIVALQPKVKQVICSLGVASHLEYWGYTIPITELDWWDSYVAEDIQFTAAPARHFSGRTTKRGQTLWSSFILKTKEFDLYLGGDSGYDTHFKQIGEKYGPFDIAILECGQYNVMWPYIHMMPEQTAQASVDLKAKILLPVHWGKFDLSLHHWDEPITRLSAKAHELNMPLTTPMIGEPVVLNRTYPDKEWWKVTP